MKLKRVESVDIYLTAEGKICLTQYDDVIDDIVHIYLTCEQFDAIEDWIFIHAAEIDLAWNGGVSDEADS